MDSHQLSKANYKSLIEHGVTKTCDALVLGIDGFEKHLKDKMPQMDTTSLAKLRTDIFDSLVAYAHRGMVRSDQEQKERNADGNRHKKKQKEAECSKN